MKIKYNDAKIINSIKPDEVKKMLHFAIGQVCEDANKRNNWIDSKHQDQYVEYWTNLIEISIGKHNKEVSSIFEKPHIRFYRAEETFKYFLILASYTYENSVVRT